MVEKEVVAEGWRVYVCPAPPGKDEERCIFEERKQLHAHPLSLMIIKDLFELRLFACSKAYPDLSPTSPKK